MAVKLVNATNIFLLLIVLAISVTGGILYVQLRTDSVSAALAEDETMRVLVVAHDEGTPFLSFVFFYDRRTQRAAVLDIPGATGSVLRPLGRVDGISALFNPDDPEPYRRQIETLTGTTVPFVLQLPRAQLVDFVDLLGGMELFIISDYRELDGSDPVLLPSGSTRLDGEKSVWYLTRFQGSEIDLEQVGRRQAFVQALLRELQRNSGFLQHRDVIPVRDRLVDTGIESRGLTAFFDVLGNIDPDRVVRRRIQGTVRRVDVEGEPRELLFPHFEGQWLKQSVQQIQQTLASQTDDVGTDAPVLVEVLNGTTRTGLARRTAELFEGYGFESRNVGNADSSSVEFTVVVDRRGIGDLAERVAEVIDARRVVTEIRPDSDVDVTVILGGDFDGTRVRSDGQ